MYSGTTFRKGSGRIVGVHQKIDRVARHHLESHIPKAVEFPGIRSILHFEGKNGPDGIKLKSPNKDELNHYIDPANPKDRNILIIIQGHIVNLTNALEANDDIKASFEAAWLAHAVVDGLTPPHHYPPSEKLKRSLLNVGRKFLAGDRKKITKEMNKRRALIKKWEYWGTRGVISHVMFEWGVASVIAPDKFTDRSLTDNDLSHLKKLGFEAVFMESVHKVNEMRMFDEFCRTGWTRQLGLKTRKVLVPQIIKTVVLAWYQAIILTDKYNK